MFKPGKKTHKRPKTANDIDWAPETLTKENLKREIHEAKMDVTWLPEVIKDRTRELLPSKFPNGRPSDRLGRAQYALEVKAWAELAKTDPKCVEMTKDLMQRRKDLAGFKRLWYWWYTFNKDRLPAFPNWNQYSLEIRQAVADVMTLRQRQILNLMRRGMSISEVADEIQVHPNMVWRTMKSAFARVSNRVGQKVYQERWLYDIVEDKGDWVTWRPRKS